MRVLLVFLAACWSSSPAPPPSQPRATTPAAAPQPTTAAPATATTDDEGDETTLNAKRWKFAGYFNRLKRKIGQNWDPTDAWTALPQVSRDRYGTQDRTTLVEITVSDRGDLVRLAIVQASGVTELDVEALRSVQASLPFEAPPPELLDPSSSTMKFKFGFWFEIGAQKSGLTIVR